jgi:hypothetical protein
MDNVTFKCKDCGEEHTMDNYCEHCDRCEYCCECVFCQYCDRIFSSCVDDVLAVDACMKECCNGELCTDCCDEVTLEEAQKRMLGDF